jgi:hypothetical protein
MRLKLKYLANHYSPDKGAGVYLDGGKLTVQAERFFGVASAMALNILSKKTSTCDNDQEGDDEIGVHEVQAGVNTDTVRSDALAEYKRLRRDQAESHPAVRLWRGIESLPNSGVLYGEIMRAARLGMTLVGTSVADERAFSCMTFIKNNLWTRLSTNLALCMHMKLQ